MKRKLRINGHSHLLPYPEEIPSYLKEKEIFWIGEDRKFMFQKNWSRPITDPSFFLHEKLQWMEKHRIDHAVVLNLSQLYGNGLSSSEMKKTLTFQNDFNAGVQRKYPSKFTCGFVVQPSFIEGALKEIERCVNDLGMQLLCLPTHYMDDQGKWQCTFNTKVEPIFELADKYNLAVEVHPYDGEKFILLENISWRFHLVWMLAQCADAYHFFTLNGYQEKYSKMRVCFAHGGQLAQINLGRRIQGFDGRRDLFEGQHHPRKAVGHKNIFFDTLVHDTGSLKLLLDNQGYRQIILGLDDPYPLGEMECDMQSSYPGKILDLALERNLISRNEFDDMWEENVLRWLCGEDEESKSTLVARIMS